MIRLCLARRVLILVVLATITGAQGPPMFKKPFKKVRFLARAASSSVEFNCDVWAIPTAKINWWKNGIMLKEKAGKYIFNGYKLTVESVTLDDEGNYTCVVRNKFGSVNWTTKLEVQQKFAVAPIIELVKNRTALVGTNVTFTCKIMSDSQPQLQWLRHYKKNDSFKNEEGEPYVKILQKMKFYCLCMPYFGYRIDRVAVGALMLKLRKHVNITGD